MPHTNLRARRRSAVSAAIAAAALLLAACSAASPAASSQTGASLAASAGCSLATAPPADATIEISGTQFGSEATIPAGGVVEFTNQDGFGHVVAQGRDGVAADGACVNEPIPAGTTLAVTFTTPGDYDITCTIHGSMNTVVHVQ